MKILHLFFLTIVAVTFAFPGQKMVQRYNRLTKTWVSYPELSVEEIQKVPLDSLLLADANQFSNQSTKWKLQTSPVLNETVVVVGICVVPPKIISYTAAGFTMVLYDTADKPSWRGILVRVNSPTDTAQAALDGFLNVEQGDVVRMTAVVQEFQLNEMMSNTQLQPIAGIALENVGSMAVPPPIHLNITDFYSGIPTSGTVKFSTGEQYEGMIVQFSNLTMPAYNSFANGTFYINDGSGNQMGDYDISKWFTKRTFRDPSSTFVLPPLNSVIDTIRGLISTSTGLSGQIGYRIGPLFPGDMIIGNVYPTISNHLRHPVIVTPDSIPEITVRVAAGTFPLDSVLLYSSINGGSFTKTQMLLNISDSLYHATIPAHIADTFVKYFIKAKDSQSEATILASAATGGTGADTSLGFFFYTVLNRPLTIQDVQFTPYKNGRSPYVGARPTLTGTITADTTQLMKTSINSSTFGTHTWYMQSGNAPWSGLWIVAAESVMSGIVNGDSISITGSIGEASSVTQMFNIQSPVIVIASGRPVPEPVDLPCSAFSAVPDGGASAEPYESMLVRFTNVAVTSDSIYFSDPTEYEINDGSGGVRVRRDGTNTFSNILGDTINGATILHEGNHVSALTGVIYFSANFYKITPRSNSDFGTVTGIRDDYTSAAPDMFKLSQNYPNPFNPSTVIEYDLAQASYVTLKVYNILGQEVASLVNQQQPAGKYTEQFGGNNLATGIYFYRLQAGNFTQVKKMVLVK